MRFDPHEVIARNSFRNFHAKGFDYICLMRSPALTLKIYFFDGDVADGSDVVIPHDHRYDFTTAVLAGTVENVQYDTGFGHVDHQRYQQFDYETPLNGGSGFTWKRETLLHEKSRQLYETGETYHQHFKEMHTIRVKPDTVLMLSQFEDRLPSWAATSSFRSGDGREPPSLDGLYEKPDVDYIRVRLQQLQQLGV